MERYERQQYYFSIKEGRNSTDSIYYSPCPCRVKYYLRPDSPLTKYLEEECQGWVRDENHKYSLNYILMVLSANFKQKKLLEFDFEEDHYWIRCNDALKKLTRKDYISTFKFRSYISNTFFEEPERRQWKSDFGSTLFLCLGKDVEMMKSIYEDDFFEMLNIDICKS